MWSGHGYDGVHQESTGLSMSDQRAKLLQWYLRLLGTIDCLALVVAFLPRSWIAGSHVALGLGDFPAEPVTGYLARSASLLYGLHGLVVLYVSQDVRRYARLIRFLAYVALVHGALLIWIDNVEGMPAWWTWSEGPLLAASGAFTLLILGPHPSCSDRLV
jgi:hypothetical protein